MAKMGGNLFSLVLSVGVSSMVSIAVIAVMTLILGEFTISADYAYANMLNILLDLSPLFTGIIMFAVTGITMVKMTGAKL